MMPKCTILGILWILVSTPAAGLQASVDICFTAAINEGYVTSQGFVKARLAVLLCGNLAQGSHLSNDAKLCKRQDIEVECSTQDGPVSRYDSGLL